MIPGRPVSFNYVFIFFKFIFPQPGSIDRYGLTPDQYVKTPSGNYFVKSGQRKGLLPEILESLLGARKKAKADLKKETDPFKAKVKKRGIFFSFEFNASITPPFSLSLIEGARRSSTGFEDQCQLRVRFYRCAGRKAALSRDLAECHSIRTNDD